MTKSARRLTRGLQLAGFRSLRNKLLALMIAASLLPLLGMSVFSYFVASRHIQDRIRLSLEKMAQDTADKIDLMLRQKKEEVHSMATTFLLIYPEGGGAADASGKTRLLNNYCFNHEVYDLLVILDNQGNIIGINSADRNGVPFPAGSLNAVAQRNIREYPEEYRIFQDSVTGHSSHRDWYQSALVHNLYDYQKDDISHYYNIALSEPIRDPATHEIVGVWINIINWFYIQNILDNVELDLAGTGLKTGYALMLAKDADTTIGHKYRSQRKLESDSPGLPASENRNFYGSKLVEAYGLSGIHDAVLGRQKSLTYEFPSGNRKILGFAAIDDTSFGWIVGVDVEGDDVFQPIRALSGWLMGATLILSGIVILITFFVAEGITVPLNSLIRTSRTIAEGDLDQRVQVRSSDELGVLGATFNDMARALTEREDQLQEMNRNLEDMVRRRTMELEKSHEALQKAYVDLQNAQEQLVQTEKMASLGQLVAGIAHEIKNPLNFIYGNTGFLADYAEKLQRLLAAYGELPSLSAADREKMVQMKETLRFSFIMEDLKTLIDNFTEGAQRINTIVSDLRAFSRMDKDAISEVDLHAALEMSLNLLSNQFKNRIEIHKDFGEIPKIQGYSGKLNQVFMNLLSNAFHAIQNQGEVWIRTRSRHGHVEVEIEDNGAGIPKENLKRIFEPFFTTKPVGQGTGLGLSISYGIIEQHQGKIHVTSVPGKGSLFTVLLPIILEKVPA